MDLKMIATVFTAVFIAELGDKTQLATFLFAADKAVSKWVIFFGASAALITTSAIGVLAGGFVSQFVNQKVLSLIAGSGFIAIGLWTIWRA